jgi:hypothetical protein
MNRISLKSFANMRSAYAAMTSLEKEYLLANKKKITVDLTLSSTSQPFHDERGRVRMGEEKVEVNAVFDSNNAKHTAELDWLKQKVDTL